MSSFDKQNTACINKENNETASCIDALLFSNSFLFPMALNAAIELDVFEIMAKAGPDAHISASEIASQLPTRNPEAASMLDRMLHLFASHSLLSYSIRNFEDGRFEKAYGLTPACKFFLKEHTEGSLSHRVSFFFHPAIMEVWRNMKDVILEGGNLFNKVHGMPLYEYMNNDPNLNNTFNSTMVGRSTLIMTQVLDIYKGYEGLKTLVDVGGGTGRCLHMIISRYSSIKGINYDLPHVIESAPSFPGIEHVAGNMFFNVPTGDAVMLKDVCHNWGDEHCIKIMKNCHEALPNNGKLIIVNAIMPQKPESRKASLYISRLDNSMLTLLAGKERTAKEYETLCNKAGFSSFVCIVDGVWGVMEAYK